MKAVKPVKDVKTHAASAARAPAVVIVVTAFTLLALFTSFMSSQQKPPIFRARIDLLQLDVTVLDKSGMPVRGLTKDDFTLLEDNKPQTIEGFTAVDIADVVTTGPVWAHAVTPDVVTNEIANQRIFVLVIDDARSMGLMEKVRGPLPVPQHNVVDLGAIKKMKEGVAQFINRLGPEDLVALLFTQRTRLNQNLTSDHARLIKAVQAFPEGGGGDLVDGPAACLGARYAIGTIKGVIGQLSTVPDRRKAIVYFGGEMPGVPMEPDSCGIYWDWRDVFTAAQQAHVTVSPVDTMGLRLNGMRDQYLTVAENTGGRAIVNTNDFGPGIQRIFRENSSYYLLAYQPTRDDDGTFRRITVTVKGRPDVEVSTRRSYWAPKAAKPTGAAAPAPPPPPDVEALAGILPLSALKLRATAAPFAVAGGPTAVVTLAIGVRQLPFVARTPEQIELLVKAFTADGDQRASDTQMIPITVPAARADSDESRYELLARIELPKPGKYEVRLSAHSIVADTRGSVYVDVDVPDFRKEKLSLSGVVLNSALPSAPVAPARVAPRYRPARAHQRARLHEV